MWEPIELGEAPGDGKGDRPIEFGRKINEGMKYLIDWLSGSSSQTKLPESLPVERGGTGSKTAQGSRDNLGISTIDYNGQIYFNEKIVMLYPDKVVANKTVENLAMKPVFTKVAVGHYTVSGTEGMAATWKAVVPKDPMGNPLYTVALTENATTKVITVKVYTGKQSGANVVVDTTKPIDIPAGAFMLLHLK